MFFSIIYGGNLVYVIKILIYFFATLGFAAFMFQMPRENLLRGLFWGTLAGTSVFFIVSWITLAQRGVDMFQTIYDALRTGNANLLQFKIFLNLFNEDVSSADKVGAALRHTTMGFMFVSLLTGIYFVSEHGRRLAWLTIMLALAALLLSVSRSQLIAVGLACFPIIVSRARASGGFLFLIAVLAYVSAFFLIFIADSSGLMNIIDERFSGFGEDGRIPMFEAAMSEINKRPIFGYGAGAEVAYGGRAAIAVHNLILAAWHQAGLLGVVSSLAFTISLLAVYCSTLISARGNVGLLAVAGLLVLPIFRSQVSGGGNYTLPEWFAIAVAFVLLHRHRSELTSGIKKSYGSVDLSGAPRRDFFARS